MTENRQSHWEDVYTSKGENEVSWYQDSPTISLDLLALAGATPASAIIDIGGGASRLVDELLARFFLDVTVLDLSAQALAVARARLGADAGRAKWIAADATSWEPPQRYDIWHDRAAFHFLTSAEQQAAYMDRLKSALAPGGHVIIGTFAPDGPEKCSGLPVMRHDANTLSALLGEGFSLLDTRRHEHATPWGSSQRFQFSTFRRAG